jgi:acetylornithine deacetylase/succinyl-diaminopimelate desuccinylase-like protein
VRYRSDSGELSDHGSDRKSMAPPPPRSWVAIDRDDVRMHGKDERVKVESYDRGVEFYYEFLKALTTRKH